MFDLSPKSLRSMLLRADSRWKQLISRLSAIDLSVLKTVEENVETHHDVSSSCRRNPSF